jgi:hypothetical protein
METLGMAVRVRAAAEPAPPLRDRPDCRTGSVRRVSGAMQSKLCVELGPARGRRSSAGRRAVQPTQELVERRLERIGAHGSTAMYVAARCVRHKPRRERRS